MPEHHAKRHQHRTRTLRLGGAALAAALVLLFATTTRAQEPQEVLTIGTVVPKHSPWGKVFRVWGRAVEKKSQGRLGLKFYWNSQQGDEATMVGKIRAGQLDGAALSAWGLSEIHRPILAMQMPGLFTDWAGIDRAREALYPEFRAAFEKQGFYLSSIAGLGRAHVMSMGKGIRTPEDLRGMKPPRLRGDVIGPAMGAVIGYTAVPISVGEVLPSLESGRIDIIVTSALAAEQMQWAPRLDHVSSDVMGIGVGATVFSLKRLEALGPELREIMKQTGDKAGAILRKRVRKLDEEAYERLKQRMTVVTLSEAERKHWMELFRKVRARLAQGTFPPDLVRRLESMAGR